MSTDKVPTDDDASVVAEVGMNTPSSSAETHGAKVRFREKETGFANSALHSSFKAACSPAVDEEMQEQVKDVEEPESMQVDDDGDD